MISQTVFTWWWSRLTVCERIADVVAKACANRHVIYDTALGIEAT